MKNRITLICLLCVLLLMGLQAKKEKAKEDQDPMSSATFSGLTFRSIGPAFTSGRIADIAVNPHDHSQYYVAVACGHIWKTDNAGITYQPVFDNYGSYSIGCLAIDPNNPHVVWAGTGENNHQRALGYGDGVYKTMDGGKTWKNMGLKESRQIGMILIDPRNSGVVYVAAEGSAWGPGGDRGLYKTIDGGENWEKVLNISEHTGVNSMVMDPRNPDIIIASSEQRRRHVHTKIGGGPETAIYKTTDGGKNWKKLTSGLPKADMGGIGLAISPAKPDVIYAIIEAADEQGGFFRSIDRGESWKKMSSHASSGQYYNEIYCDPKDPDLVYSVETVTHYTEDGGKTFQRLGLEYRHVDDHALWIDPQNTLHLIIGGDGGLYETYDRGSHWQFKSNLPVTQFYRVSVDNSLPFYYVYGGTQDNNSMGGPSRNTSSFGVAGDEWFITNGGDGFWTCIDPENPNIVYAEAQYGWMVRYDRASGERKQIRPQPRKGEKTYRWNWNTPLILSSHSNTRLYCAANKVFRSDDRGDSWKVISPDLTAQIDRNRWPVMGKYWSADSVVKDVSSSLYGTIVSMVESPIKEDLIFIGTDDGLIQMTENAGESWTRIDRFPGIPPHTYVSDIMASRHDDNVVFAAFDNRKRDDFTPYILKSTDRGQTWTSISGNLPKNGTVHTLEQDRERKDLLFAGTEFGVFFSVNGGKKWIQLKSGIPAVAVRDMAIQERENDLVLATFGRGFYILDDYTPLREINPDILEKKAHLFSIKDALMYIEKPARYGQGATYWAAKNPPFGTTFTYYIKEVPLTQKQIRKKKEKKLFEKGEPIPDPGWDRLREESREEPPFIIFSITDDSGNLIRELRAKPKKGINRINWDLRYIWPDPVDLKKNQFDPFAKDNTGMLVMPGTYRVSISQWVNRNITPLVGPVSFTAKILENTTLPAKNRREMVDFQKKVSDLSRILQGTYREARELRQKMTHIKQAILTVPGGVSTFMTRVKAIEDKLDKIIFAIRGHSPRASREEIPPSPAPLISRLYSIIYAQYRSTSAPGKTQYDSYGIITEELAPLLTQIKKIAGREIPELEKDLDKAQAPWTPGRIMEK